MASKLDMLLEIAAEENRLVKYPVEIAGRDFTYWAKAATAVEFQAAKRASKNKDDLIEQSIQLFILRALNEDGSRQYDASAYPVLKRLGMDNLTKLVNADPEEDLEVGQVNIKSTSKGAAKAA